jgi:hypothetical protein
MIVFCSYLDEIFSGEPAYKTKPTLISHKSRLQMGHTIALWLRRICYKLANRGLEIRRGELIFSIYLILQVALGPVFTRPLTEMSSRSIKIFVETRARPMTKANFLESVRFSISLPYRPPRPGTGIDLLFYKSRLRRICGKK